MTSPIPAGLLGLIAGILSGAFGIGGGIVTTPAIRLLFGAPALIAVGTPLPIVIPTAVTGAVSYARRGLVDVRVGLLIGGVGAAFSVAGAYASDLAGGPAIMLMTAGLILYLALDMVRQAMRPALDPAQNRPAEDAPPVPARRAALIGAVTGVYSGLLGLGGGLVIVPLLVRWTRFPMKRAIGTSLLAVGLLAVPGSIAHWLLGHVDLELAGWLALGVIPGALLGAKLTAIAREKHVEIGFAALLLVTGLFLALSEMGAVG